MADEADEAFDEFVNECGDFLARTALLLAGDRAQAEDLLQSALLKTYRRWHRVSRYDSPAAFVRRVMVNEVLSRRRRRWREESVARLPEAPDRPAGEEYDRADTRDVLWRAIATLSPRTRAVLVLRYWEDLSEVDAAAVLGCSVGSVKSQASRGLARLREVLAASSASADLAEGGPG